jgi:hypothetical protein
VMLFKYVEFRAKGWKENNFQVKIYYFRFEF